MPRHDRIDESSPHYGASWESLIKDRMRPASHVDKVEDPVERNRKTYQRRYQRKLRADHPEEVRKYQRDWKAKWYREHHEEALERARRWRMEHPDKVKVYQERAKEAIKRWHVEHRERSREINRANDRKRRKDPKRQEWTREYLQRPEVRERRRLADMKRNATPERKEYMRQRGIRRREAAKAAKNGQEAA